MKEEFEVREGVVLKWDEKSYQDTKQLAEQKSKESLLNLISLMEQEIDPSKLCGIYLEKGKKYWLQIEISDPNMSSQLFGWLCDYSKFDGNRLSIFGCFLDAIMNEKPTGYTEEEKQAIKLLNEKING